MTIFKTHTLILDVTKIANSVLQKYVTIPSLCKEITVEGDKPKYNYTSEIKVLHL